MKNDLTTGAWQYNIWCPINITLFCTSHVVEPFAGQEAWLWYLLQPHPWESLCNGLAKDGVEEFYILENGQEHNELDLYLPNLIALKMKEFHFPRAPLPR